MRVALHSVLREGQEAGYDRVHARVPEELAAALRRAGIADWTIWRSGRNLFHVVDCVDFAAAMRALSIDPANQRWQDFIGDYVDHFVADGDRPEDQPLREVWELAQQGATS